MCLVLVLFGFSFEYEEVFNQILLAFKDWDLGSAVFLRKYIFLYTFTCDANNLRGC